jgi:antitoxin (DNA-binding transcriptional repressor) of toxin-antitoxin stability system
MKTISISDAQGQLPQLVAEALGGETIVLTDGDRSVTICPGNLLDLDEDSPALAAELMKAAKGPFTPYSRADLEAVAERVRRQKGR